MLYRKPVAMQANLEGGQASLHGAGRRNILESVMEKGPPYGLEVIQSCLSCPVREERLFCQLGPRALAELNTIRQSSVCPKGAVLFLVGQPPRGVFILCSGRAKLIATSTGERSLIVRVADPGEVLGLSAVMSNAAYDVTAEALELTQVSFIPRDQFLRFLESHGEVSVRVAEHLSQELRRAYSQVARIALAPTARAKLAGLLLDWADRDTYSATEGASFQLRMTREEIGELIGSSRETITDFSTTFAGRA